MLLVDRTIFIPTAGGTADFTVSAATPGYMTPTGANARDTGLYSYWAQSIDLSQWEGGTGTWSAGTTKLVRTTVLFNSASTGTQQSGAGTKINFSTIPQVTLTALTGDFTRVQRSITSSGNLPITINDEILNINVGSDLTPTVPAYAARVGSPLTFKNLPSSHAQTLTPTAPDTFDGFAFYVLQPGASVTLVPYNDGVNTGYAIT